MNLIPFWMPHCGYIFFGSFVPTQSKLPIGFCQRSLSPCLFFCVALVRRRDVFSSQLLGDGRWGYYCLWKAVNNANRIEQTTCRADRIIHREMGQRDANGNLVKRCGLFLALLLRKQVQIASVMSTSRDATSMVDYTNSAGTQVP